MGNCTVDVAKVNLFTCQRGIRWQSCSQHDRQIGVVRVINELQARFLRRRTQQGLRHISASLSEFGIDNQQRFHTPLPLLVKRFQVDARHHRGQLGTVGDPDVALAYRQRSNGGRQTQGMLARLTHQQAVNQTANH